MEGNKDQAQTTQSFNFTPGGGTVGASTGFNLISGATTNPAATSSANALKGLPLSSATTTGFNFGSPQGGATNFAVPAATTSATFNFASPASTSATPNFGFPSVTSAAPSFHYPVAISAAASAPPNFSFPTVPLATTSATGFNLPAASSTTTSTLMPNFGLPGTATTTTGAAMTTPVMTSSTLNLSSSAAPTFGMPQPITTPAAPTFGMPQPTTTPAAPTFGMPQPTTTPTSTLNFGSKSISAPTVNLASPAKTSATPAAPTPAPLSFSQPPATSASVGLVSDQSKMGVTTSPAIGALQSPKPLTLMAPTTTSGPATTTTASSLGGLPPQQPTAQSITFSQLEEMINKWAVELSDQERIFLNQATQINAWDNLLGANCIRLTNLNSSVEKVKAEQKKISYDLDFILAQQKELDACLAPLEKEYTSSIYTTDTQREHIYMMAQNIDSQLKRMSEDLKETIDHINETSRSQESVDPVVQIGKILNAHMNSLQWIDENTTRLQAQLEAVNKVHDSFKRETDNIFSTLY